MNMSTARPKFGTRDFGFRTGVSPTAKKVATGLLAFLTAFATVVIAAGTSPASASTVNGIATIAAPGTTNYLASGGSNSLFTVSLPLGAACDGDTASHGYHVYSYLVPKGTNLSTVTFEQNPSTGFGIFDANDDYYGPVNTGIGTGLVLNAPNNFQWAPLAAVSSTLLSTTGGVWEAGLACANTSGVLTDNWNTEVTFTASSSDPNGFVWSDVPGPSGSTPAAVTSASSATFTTGTAGSFTPTATGSPSPTITESGTLPTGVTFAGGVLSGTPTQSGVFHLTFTANNGIENPATQAFTLTVDGAPAITSASNASFTSGSAGSFTVTATGYPAPTFGETGTLPTGITLNATTGVLSGTTTQSGSFPITLSASNGVGSSVQQSFSLVVNAAPAITSASNASFTSGSAGSFTVTATGYPAPTFGETGTLPTGITLNATTGVLSGTPTQSGSFPITLSASNGVGTAATQSFTLTVSSSCTAGPVITSSDTATATVGTPFTFTVQSCSATAPVFKEAGLPKGLKLTDNHNGTATITGTALSKDAASATATITATVKEETPATQSLVITVLQAPVFTNKTKYLATTGTALSYPVTTAYGNPTPALTAAGLPSGVTLIDNGDGTAVLSGTPTANAGGAYTVTFTATNGVGTPVTQSFSLTVYQAPAVTSGTSDTVTAGVAITPFTVTTTGYPLPKLKAKLPKGLTFTVNPDGSGTIAGTPVATDTGIYAVAIGASNKAGATTQTLNLSVDNPGVFTSKTAAKAKTGTHFTYAITTADGYPSVPVISTTTTLPSGVTLVDNGNGTAVLGGTPAAGTSGVYPIVIEATNGVTGSPVSQTVNLTIT